MSLRSIFNEDMALAPEEELLLVASSDGNEGLYKVFRDGVISTWVDRYGSVIGNPEQFTGWYRIIEPTFSARQVRAMIQEVWSEGYDIEVYLKSKGI